MTIDPRGLESAKFAMRSQGYVVVCLMPDEAETNEIKPGDLLDSFGGCDLPRFHYLQITSRAPLAAWSDQMKRLLAAALIKLGGAPMCRPRDVRSGGPCCSGPCICPRQGRRCFRPAAGSSKRTSSHPSRSTTPQVPPV